MTEVTIRIDAHNRTYQLPENWQECRPDQVHLIASVVLMRRTIAHELELLRGLLQLPTAVWDVLPTEELLRLLDLLDWAWHTPLTTPVVPELGKVRPWLLPDAKLENVTCYEWYLADTYYRDFLTTAAAEPLAHLTATLCRERDPNEAAALRRGDRRVMLHSELEVMERTKRQTTLSTQERMYVAYFFSSCKQWIYDTFRGSIFPHPDEGTDASAGNPFGWMGLFKQVAETGVYGSLDDVLKRTRFLDFCGYLVHKKLEAERERRRWEAERRKNNRR